MAGAVMEKSQALYKLLESADLLRMIEDLAAAGAYEKLSAPGLAGFKITLRNVREAILASHDQLAREFVEQTRAGMEVNPNNTPEIKDRPASQNTTMTTTPPIAAMMQARQASAVMADANKSGEQPPYQARTTIISDPQRLQMMRKDLRTSIEKMVEGNKGS